LDTEWASTFSASAFPAAQSLAQVPSLPISRMSGAKHSRATISAAVTTSS